MIIDILFFHRFFVDMLNIISTCRDILCVDINVDKCCVDHSTIKNNHFSDLNFKFQLHCFDVRSNFVYCSCLYLIVLLCMVTIISHIFPDVSQRKQISALKFYIGYEKNMRFLLIPISSLKTKSEKLDQAPVRGVSSFKGYYTPYQKLACQNYQHLLKNNIYIL